MVITKAVMIKKYQSQLLKYYKLQKFDYLLLLQCED